MGSVPTYIVKHRQSYVLQRAVPRPLQEAIGRRVWKLSGGMTLQQARAALQGFLDATDREIAIAKGELTRTPDEQIDRLADTCDLNDPEVVQLLEAGFEIDEDLTPAQRERGLAVAKGEERSAPFSGEDLIRIASSLKKPAAKTLSSWKRELDTFLKYCNTYSPLYCTRQQAVDYRTHLLSSYSADTAKTKLKFLGGLWSVLEEVKGTEHIFKGLLKRIKVVKEEKDYSCLNPDEWKDHPKKTLFLILYYTGVRANEAAGLMYEDIKDDRIIITPHKHRPLKNAASKREIPIHPKLKPILSELKGTGRIWTVNSNNLSAPCRMVTGINPHGHRHNLATSLRNSGYNEVVIGKLLGHTLNTTSSGYGSVAWDKLVEAISSV